MIRPRSYMVIFGIWIFATFAQAAPPLQPNDLTVDNHDALQALLDEAHSQGNEVALPVGVYAYNGPLTLDYKSGHPYLVGIRGVGPTTQLYCKNLKAGEAALNLLGT